MFERQRLQVVLIQRRLRRSLILGRVIRERAGRDFGHDDASVFHSQHLIGRDSAHHRGGEVPFFANLQHVVLAPWLRHQQHPFLRFGQENFVRSHVGLTPWNVGYFQLYARSAPGRHFA